MLSFSASSPGTAAGMNLRAWVLFSTSGAVLKSSPNVTSVTRAGTGSYTINLAAAMPDTAVFMDVKPQYSVGVSPGTAGVQFAVFPSLQNPQVLTWTAGASADCAMYVGIYG